MPKAIPSMSSRKLVRLLRKGNAHFLRQGKTDHAIYERVVEGEERSRGAREQRSKGAGERRAAGEQRCRGAGEKEQTSVRRFFVVYLSFASYEFEKLSITVVLVQRTNLRFLIRRIRQCTNMDQGQ